MSFLQTPLMYLKGVGSVRAEAMAKELGLHTVEDMLMHFPFRYVDRSAFHAIRDLNEGMVAVQIKGRIIGHRYEGKGRAKRLQAVFRDEHGEEMDLVWFQGHKWVEPMLSPGREWIVFGKPARFKNRFSMVHPELEDPREPRASGALQPVYPLTEQLRNRKIDQRLLLSVIHQILSHPDYQVPEFLPPSLLQHFNLMGRADALRYMHLPENASQQAAALRRMKFEELFVLQMRILRMKTRRDKALKGEVFSKVGDLFHSFYEEHLPFKLTEAQKRVIREIRADMATGKQMNRLLQGDVGSGKTIVALLIALLAMDNGYQVSLMAPTEILAQQHYQGISELVKNIPVEVALLTGSSSQSSRKVLLPRLESGEVNLLIGTHALIEDQVKMARQGLVIIDEQHRFGVQQRARLWQKSEIVPHVLVMTATPIPRTLAMTVYGDLDVSVIDELPQGRKPIKTIHKDYHHRGQVYDFMRKEIEKGRQIYVVYPLIEESENMDYKDLSNGFDQLVEVFERPRYQVDMLHGKMKQQDKDAVMERFKNGTTNILVSTTVIEVGVNVPNASVMIIESAEKFGLAQLHQLRGRVGRGSEQSYCILMSGHKLSKQARERLGAMVRTNNGFEIAEMDMRLRGPGDMEGTRQSGLNELKLSSIVQDAQLLEESRYAAQKLLQADPELSAPPHHPLRNYLNRLKGARDWSRVS